MVSHRPEPRFKVGDLVEYIYCSSYIREGSVLRIRIVSFHPKKGYLYSFAERYERHGSLPECHLRPYKE